MDFWTQINQKKEVRTVISRHYSKFRENCAKVIEEGKQSGDFKDIDSNEYASFIIGLVDGLSLQWLFDETGFDYDSTINNASKLVLDGLLK